MSKFTDRELKRYAVAGAVVGFTGFILLLAGQTMHNDKFFTAPYTAGLKGIAWLLLFSGILWFGMAMAHLCTSFFSVKEALSVDKAILSVSIIVIIFMVSAYVSVVNLPDTPKAKQPQDQKARAALLKKESKDRQLYVPGVIFLVGAAFAAFPITRCCGPILFPANNKPVVE